MLMDIREDFGKFNHDQASESYDFKSDYDRTGFLNLCSAEHFCSAALNIVFREKIKKIKNILAQIKEIKKYL
jgi:hypothetical protein